MRRCLTCLLHAEMIAGVPRGVGVQQHQGEAHVPMGRNGPSLLEREGVGELGERGGLGGGGGERRRLWEREKGGREEG